MRQKLIQRTRDAGIPISRWLAYATAGAASALAGAGAVQADITVVDVNELFDAGPGSRAKESFQLPGGNKISLSQSNFGNGFGIGIFDIRGGGQFIGDSQVETRVKTNPGSSGGSSTYKVTYYHVAKLPFGAAIAQGNFLNQPSETFGSEWSTAGKGYIGFRFSDAGQTEFGWVGLTTQGSPSGDFTLNSYAYTTDGESLLTGQVPEPGSLALLAVGGAGLLAWRQRRGRS